MRASLGIDKTKSWADWAEEEEDQCPVWPEVAMTDYRMAMPSSPPSSTAAIAESITITASEVTPHTGPCLLYTSDAADE